MRLNPLVANAPVERFGPVLKYSSHPDFIDLSSAHHHGPVAPHIVAALHDALGRDVFRYGAMAGEAALLDAIAEKVRRRNGLEVDPRTEVRVTNGAGHAFLMTLMAFLSPGDEVLSPDPSFPLNWFVPRMLGATVVGCPIDGPGGVEALPDRMAEAITPRTKAITFHPVNNPTGHVIPRRVIERIAELAERHDLLVLSDEVYEWFAYDGTESISIASFPGLKKRTATIFGFAKEYNLPGLRVGYVVTSPEISRAIARIQANGPVGASVLGQYGALAALTGPHDSLERLVAELAESRRCVVDALASIPGVRVAMPQGGFFVFPDVSAHTPNVDDLYARIAAEAKVGVAAGTWYGAGGAGHIRICYGSQERGRVLEAIARIASLLAAGG